MSRKERAKIARQNGAKSQGPITAAGKAASCQNANKSEEYAQKLAPFLPAHSAVLCNEDRDAYTLTPYLPLSEALMSVAPAKALA